MADAVRSGEGWRVSPADYFNTRPAIFAVGQPRSLYVPMRDGCRLEVEDPGRDGVIAPQPQDLRNGGGMGLNLVQMLSERWGVVRAAEGPTRVWAQLPRVAAPGISPGARGQEADPCLD